MGRGKRLASVRSNGSTYIVGDPEMSHLETCAESLASLRGLREIYLEVARLEPEIEEEGLATKQIEAYAEGKFREAGIKRLSQVEFERQTKDWAALYVHVGIVRVLSRSTPKYYVYRIYIQLHQDALLVRQPNPVKPVITWWTAGLGGADSLNTVWIQVRDSLDEFVSAYLSVNPK